LQAVGAPIIEYSDEVTGSRRATARQRSDIGNTFPCGLSDGRVIDGSRGKSAGFIARACTSTAR
jgi:hypothetical protein